MASNLSEQTTLEDLGDGRYQSRFNPERMGNNQPIAFGGCSQSDIVLEVSVLG